MSQSTVSIEARSVPMALEAGSRRIGLTMKIVGTLAGVIVVFALLVIGVVYHLTVRALRAQVDQRALTIATIMSDAAAGHVIARNALELNSVVAKSALLEGVAYAYIQDNKGEVLAQSPAALPPEVREPVTADVRRQPAQQELTLRGKTVYETRVPILGGQVGTAHVAIWGDVVEEQIRAALFPLIGIILALTAVGVALSILLARDIIRPILRLTHVADRISLGDLDMPIGVEASDEIGDLAKSLGRMRASLKAAMVRLSQTRSIPAAPRGGERKDAPIAT
ncbi:MAG TPA: HAMP domain-containing protein [Candidatus Binatia bacterium]|jgi:HAMP domain-containing protein